MKQDKDLIRIYPNRGHIAQCIAYLLPTLGSIPSIPKFFSEEILKLLSLTHGTAENSGQRLDNVNRTHLALASGKLVLQKKNSSKRFNQPKI